MLIQTVLHFIFCGMFVPYLLEEYVLFLMLQSCYANQNPQIHIWIHEKKGGDKQMLKFVDFRVLLQDERMLSVSLFQHIVLESCVFICSPINVNISSVLFVYILLYMYILEIPFEFYTYWGCI